MSQVSQLKEKGISVRQIAKIVGLSKSTVHRLLSHNTGIVGGGDTDKQHVFRGSKHIERAGYRYILDESWKDTKHVLIERSVLERQKSIEHGIPFPDISSEYWISGECYAREDLTQYRHSIEIHVLRQVQVWSVRVYDRLLLRLQRDNKTAARR